MKRLLLASMTIALCVPPLACERALEPDDYRRTCTSDDDGQCMSVRWLYCTSQCSAMAVNTDEGDQVTSDVNALEATCGAAFIEPICRTSAFSAECREGSCTLVDSAGDDLGVTSVGPNEGAPLPN
jgi:hypothetical protein